MIVLLKTYRAVVSALIAVCVFGGFLFAEAIRPLRRKQKFLTNEIERRRA